MRTVEGEQPRLDFRNGKAGHRAGEFRRKNDAFRRRAVSLALGAFGEFRHRQPVGEVERGLETFGQPGGNIGPHHDPVHHHVDVMLEFLVERRRVGDVVELAVDFQALEAALHVFGDFLAIFALAAARDRGQQIKPVRSGRASTRSTIWLTVWLSIGRPVAGE